jgi:hypothetical protein
MQKPLFFAKSIIEVVLDIASSDSRHYGANNANSKRAAQNAGMCLIFTVASFFRQRPAGPCANS